MKHSIDETEAAIYRRKPTTAQQVEGLALFAPVPSAVAPGAGQLARQEARAKTDAATDRATILDTLTAHADGLTRTELEDVTGIPRNTINARVAELCEAQVCYTDGHRTREVAERGRTRLMKESIVRVR